MAQALFTRGKELLEEESKEKGKEKEGKSGKEEVDEEDESMDVDDEKEDKEEKDTPSEEHKPFCLKEFTNNKGYGTQKQLSPLTFAVLCNRPALARLLLENEASATEKVTAPGKNSKASLLMFIRSKYEEFVEILIKGGAIPGSFTGLFLNVYHDCATYGRNELLEALLKFEKANHAPRLQKDLNTIAIAEGKMVTPLLSAIAQGNLKAAKMLHEAGGTLVVDKKTCDTARTRATNYKIKKYDWSMNQGIRKLKEVAPDQFPSAIWMVVYSLVSECVRVGEGGGRGKSVGNFKVRGEKMAWDDVTEAWNEVFGFRETLKKLSNVPEVEVAGHVEEEQAREAKSARLFYQDQMERSKEILTWLMGVGGDVNGKVGMKAVKGTWSSVRNLFQTQTQGDKKEVLVSGLSAVRSAIKQLESNHDSFVKDENMKLEAFPSDPVEPYGMEIDAMTRLLFHFVFTKIQG